IAALVSLAVAICQAQSTPTLLFDRRLRTGQYFLEKKQYGRAVSEFESAVSLAPDRAEGYYNLGSALRLWGELDGAQRGLRKAIGLRPQFPEAHCALGWALGDQVGAEREGLAEFEEAVSQQPSYSEAHFNIGIVHWKANETDAAIIAFRRAVELNPKSAV